MYLNDDIRISRIEIEINTHCNRNCGYCPSSKKELNLGEKYMDENLFKLIINKILDISHLIKRISYHFYSEPLLHPDLCIFTKYAKEMLPHCINVIYTNGDYLSDTKYYELMQSGVDYIIITNHENRNIPKRAKQRILSVSGLNFTNRGGSLFKLKHPLSTPCFAPSYRLMITYNGDVILCYEDSERKNVFGNLKESSIKFILNSNKYKYIRDQLEKGNRKNIIPCRFCNNEAHNTPKQINVNIIP